MNERTQKCMTSVAAAFAFAVTGLVYLFTFIPPSFAAELPEYYRGTRAMAMGGAYTAVANDLDSVFYNPAGLALNENYTLELINPKFGVSGDIVHPDIDVGTNTYKVASDLSSTFRNFNSSSISSLFGKHLYADASVFPALSFPGFAFGYYYAGTAHLVARNTVYPQVELMYLRDSGYVTGFGTETRGFGRGHFLRMGVSGKYITREGIDTVVPISDMLTADKHYVSALKKGPAKGIGVTAGIQYEMQLSHRSELVVGSAWQDIGNVTFGNSLTPNPPPPVQQNLSAGLAWIEHFGSRLRPSKRNYKLTAEMRHLTDSHKDPRLKMHFGGELELGLVSLQAGYNQSSFTGGFAVDFWFLHVAALTYGEDIQSIAGMDRERRYLLQLTFKIDVMGTRGMRDRDLERRKHPRNY